MTDDDVRARVEHAAERLSRNPTAYAKAARAVGRATGSWWAFTAMWALLVVWVVVGAGTGFTRWWELTVTVGFPFLTLALLTVLQHTQNHDTRAISLKLDELIATLDGASDAMLRVEDASEEDLRGLQEDFSRRTK